MYNHVVVMLERSHLDNGNLGAAIDSFMALVSVVFAGTYVANTYIPYNDVRTVLCQ